MSTRWKKEQGAVLSKPPYAHKVAFSSMGIEPVPTTVAFRSHDVLIHVTKEPARHT